MIGANEVLYFNGRPIVERRGLLGDERSDRLRAAFDEMLRNIKAFGDSLTPREKLILEIGLKASHVEESAASGDWKRAEAHMDRLVKLLEQFRSSR
jgi:hypothetical protein